MNKISKFLFTLIAFIVIYPLYLVLDIIIILKETFIKSSTRFFEDIERMLKM